MKARKVKWRAVEVNPWGRNCKWATDLMPGIAVFHCGHPKALYPYGISIHGCPLGYTFPNLRAAKTFAEEHLARGEE